MQGQMNTPQMAAQPQQAAQPQGAPQGQSDPMAFIRELHDLLLLRIEAAGQKNPSFGQAIDVGISPEAAQELFMILPEFKVIYDAIENAGGGRPAPIQGGGQQPMQETDNPLLRDMPSGVSRGLVG